MLVYILKTQLDHIQQFPVPDIPEDYYTVLS